MFLNLADNKLIKVESFDFTDSSIEAIIKQQQSEVRLPYFQKSLTLKD